MEDFWGVTDESVSTRQRYDLIAKHNVIAYKSALRSVHRNKREDEVIFGVIWKLIKYMIIIPVFFILKHVGIWLLKMISNKFGQKNKVF